MRTKKGIYQKKNLRRTRRKHGGGMKVRNLSKVISGGPTFFPPLLSVLKDTLNLGLGKKIFKTNFHKNSLRLGIN
jgi:hypothetical protein